MGSELLKMAESLAVVVESLCVLAGIQKSENAGAGVRPKEKTETGNGMDAGMAGKKSTENSGAKETPVAVEDIRAVLAQKSQDGKSKEIKELLGRYGAVKLSAVKQEDYPALLAEAKVL
ncbi:MULTISPECIES: hypothetical protein [Blautia]|uniref:hypothetical protein n=1 Tax=Blautia TaxID=572511 RepID=UPI000BA2CA33|nr:MULTISPECIES: hypothetical protein [Blautia]